MEHPSSRPKTFLKWAIALAIVIVSNLFFYYAIALVYPEPTFEDFCPARNEQYMNPEVCVENGGQWSNFGYAPSEITKAVKAGEPTGWCDANFTCNQDYNDSHSVYNRNVFVILISLSIAVLVLSVFVGVEVLALGFSWTGIVSLIIASARYWSDADNWMRVLILAIALGLLIGISVKKFKD